MPRSFSTARCGGTHSHLLPTSTFTTSGEAFLCYEKKKLLILVKFNEQTNSLLGYFVANKKDY